MIINFNDYEINVLLDLIEKPLLEAWNEYNLSSIPDLRQKAMNRYIDLSLLKSRLQFEN